MIRGVWADPGAPHPCPNAPCPIHSQGGQLWILDSGFWLPKPPREPPAPLCWSAPRFLPAQHFPCLQPRQLAGCKSEPRPVWPRFAQPRTLARRVGRNYLGSRGNHPGVCSLLALAARSLALSCTGTAAGEGFFPAPGIAWCVMVPGRAPRALGSWGAQKRTLCSMPALQCSNPPKPSSLCVSRAAEHVLQLDCWRCSSSPGRWSV